MKCQYLDNGYCWYLQDKPDCLDCEIDGNKPIKAIKRRTSKDTERTTTAAKTQGNRRGMVDKGQIE